MDYRSWLQNQATNHADAGTRSQAQALLNVVGNDQKLDQRFINQEDYKADGITRKQSGGSNPFNGGNYSNYSNGFSAYEVNRLINPQFIGMYNADMAKMAGEQNESNQLVGGGASGGSGPAGLSSAQRATIDNQWSQNNQYYNDLLGSIDPRKAAAQQGIDRQVDTSTASLGGERDAAYQNLDRQDSKLEKGYAQGRQSLGEQVRNTLQGQSNNIGMLGGGNSSAIQMLGVGTADVQNQEQGKMLDDLNEQKTDIEINRSQVKQKLDDELRKLNDFKISKYQEIQDQFNDQRNEILNKLNANDNQRAQALASAGAAATQFIQSVDATIKNRLGQIADAYKNIQGPAVSLASVPAYQATNIAGPKVSLDNTPQTQLTPDQATQAVLPRRPQDDETLQLIAPVRRDDQIL